MSDGGFPRGSRRVQLAPCFTPEFTERMRRVMRFLHEQERLHKHSPPALRARMSRQRIILQIRSLRRVLEDSAVSLSSVWVREEESGA